MRVQNLTPFPFATRATSRRPPEPEMTVVVRGTWILSPGQPLRLPADPPGQGRLGAERFHEDDDDRAGECLYPGDLADFKPRADALLRGVCHAPDDGRGRAAAEHPVRFAVGRWSRTRRVAAGEPAGFGPVNPAWPERASKVGKEYGASYRQRRAPWYAEDFDFGHFNAAPADQQLPGYLRGDEELVFENLHPGAPRFSARLPGVRVRAFVSDDRGRFREVALHLDTLFADLTDPAGGLLFLTWRGLDPVREDDLADVRTLRIAQEALADPRRPEAEHRAGLERFERDPVGLDAQIPEELRAGWDELQRRGPGAASGGAAPAADPVSALLADRLGPLGAAEKDRVASLMGALLAVPAPPGVDLAALLASAVGRLPAPAPAPLPPLGSTPRVPLAATLRGLADKIAGTGQPRAAGELAAVLQEPRLAAVDPALKGGDPPPEPGPGQNLEGRDFTGRDLRGVDLTGAVLTGAVLTRADLRGVKLTGARLDLAVLFEANLADADLTGADLTLANLVAADLTFANLTRARLDRTNASSAVLRAARLGGATGSGAVLFEADLSFADARGVQLHEALADRATLQGTAFSGASLVACRFAGARAREVDLSGAVLTGTSFADADLTGAKVVEVDGEGSVWIRAVLEGADLRYASLPGAHFTEARARGARLSAADLREARFYRADLEGADLSQANLLRAELGKARVPNARFQGANLYGAQLRDLSGAGADFTGANLLRSQPERG